MNDVLERRLKEFSEATQMHRFEATLLFGELTVYLAMFGALLSVAFKGPPIDAINQIGISIIGIAVTFSFAVINERGIRHLRAVIRRAEELGRELEMQLYEHRPVGGRILTGLNGVRLLYAVGGITWLLKVLIVVFK